MWTNGSISILTYFVITFYSNVEKSSLLVKYILRSIISSVLSISILQFEADANEVLQN
jgi:hypothetical protein